MAWLTVDGRAQSRNARSRVFDVETILKQAHAECRLGGKLSLVNTISTASCVN